jgi:hypothetical protein
VRCECQPWANQDPWHHPHVCTESAFLLDHLLRWTWRHLGRPAIFPTGPSPVAVLVIWPTISRTRGCNNQSSIVRAPGCLSGIVRRPRFPTSRRANGRPCRRSPHDSPPATRHGRPAQSRAFPTAAPPAPPTPPADAVTHGIPIDGARLVHRSHGAPSRIVGSDESHGSRSSHRLVSDPTGVSTSRRHPPRLADEDEAEEGGAQPATSLLQTQLTSQAWHARRGTLVPRGRGALKS